MGLDGQGIEDLEGLGEVYRRDQLVNLVVPEVVREDDQALLDVLGLKIKNKYLKLFFLLNPCILSLLGLTLHGLTLSRKISSVAPP